MSNGDVTPHMLIIDLQAYLVTCRLCGKDTDNQDGVPMYEDYVLPNDWTGEWFGQPACVECADRQSGLTRPVSLKDFAAWQRQ